MSISSNAPDAPHREAVTSDSLLVQSTATNAAELEPALPAITTVEVDGLTVYHRDSGAERPGPTFVLVHGLGGSLANWEPLWPFLTPFGRVLAPDLAGFGRTQAGADRSAVGSNVELLHSYLERVGARDVVLVGNSMGGMISILTAAQHNPRIDRLVLIDPVMPLGVKHRPHWMVAVTFGLYLCAPLARFVIPRYAKHRGLERLGVDGVVNVVADPRRVPKWVVRRAVEETKALAQIQSAVPALVRAAQSLVIAAISPSYRRAMDAIDVPVTLVHGERDHLVPVGAARETAVSHPSWRYVEADGLGHVPMFEAARWVAAITADQVGETVTNV